jgi:hypothetical protein
MSNRTKKQVSEESDIHICRFLLSPFNATGLKSYKLHYGVTFPEPSKQITNRVEYLKRIQQADFIKFARICNSYNIRSSFTTFYDSSESASSDSDSIYCSSNHSLKQAAPVAKKTKAKKAAMSVASSKSNLFNHSLRNHQEKPNFDFPSLNKFGMMWLRDDDVEIGDSMCSILTIVQPLFDARDHDQVNIYLDADDPAVLKHVHPNVPTFMYQDWKKVHELEESDDNPEIYTETRKKHKKHAFKIVDNKQLKLQTSEYQLPFSLSLDKFDDIEHTSSKIQKHYRTIVVPVDNKIKHTCAYVFWKILIDGETTHCSGRVREDRNVYEEAKTRMCNAFNDINLGGNVNATENVINDEESMNE